MLAGPGTAEISQVPQLVAHRGDPTRFPENTLIGLEGAAQAGARFVEVDIQLTSDQVPVLYHDRDLWRVSQCRGSILDTSFDALQSLDAAFSDRFGEKFRGEPIPTLEQFCEYLTRWPDLQAFVEIKSESLQQWGIATVMNRVDAIARPRQPQITLIAFDYECLVWIRQHLPYRIGWILSQYGEEPLVAARALAPDYLFCSHRLLPTAPAMLRQDGWKWAIYTLDTPKEARSMGTRGVALVETDRIGWMLQSLNRE